MKKFRSEEELDQVQTDALRTMEKAERIQKRVEDNRPVVENIVEALKKRRKENHFGRDYEVTMRART